MGASKKRKVSEVDRIKHKGALVERAWKRIQNTHTCEYNQTWQEEALNWAKPRLTSGQYADFNRVVLARRNPLKQHGVTNACHLKEMGLVVVSEGFVMISKRSKLKDMGACDA
jgi:hypothetical protein